MDAPKKILITRNQAMNKATAMVLHDRGFLSEACPLTELVDTGAVIPESKFGGVIFTSQAALRILTQREEHGELLSRELPVFAVGEKTATLARSIGFQNIITGSGSASGLTDVIKQRGPKLPLLYLAGVDRSIEIEAGEIHLVELYQTKLLDPGKARLQNSLKQVSGGCAFLYSVRTALHLFKLISCHDLEKDIENVTFIAISKNVADAVESKVKSPVLIAHRPTQMTMIELVG